MYTLIKNGTVVDPVAGTLEKKDVLIADGKIAKVAENISATDAQIIDAENCVVMPGFVDLHCHLREPGFEKKETILSGCQAAVKGGFTSIACMPNTNPVIDSAQTVEYIMERVEEANLAHVYPYGAITKGQKGEELTEMGKLKNAGVKLLSDDGCPVNNSQIMRLALSYARNFDMLIVSHCEDKALAEGSMNEGYYSSIQGLKGISNAAEEVMVARDIILADSLNTRIHLAHISTRGSVALIRDAKKRGIKVTCETAPHYYSGTDALCDGFNTMAKVNPPLRTQADMDAICEGMADGTIDCIATDHAPHHVDDKNVEFDMAANGISGFETAFGLTITNILNKGILTLPQISAMMSYNPAKIMGIDAGTMNVGQPADIVVANLDEQWTVKGADFVSKGKNTPFEGQTLNGVIKYTLVDGRIVYRSEN
jgi:dihydroorotase